MTVNSRFHFIDELRGIAIIYVVIYHTIYDFTYYFPQDISIIEAPWMYIIRDIMVGMLIFISGISCNFSKSNLRRGLRTIFYALLITLVTFFMGHNYIITFGILHFLGVSIMIYAYSEKLFKIIPSFVGILLFMLFFMLLYSNSNLYSINTSSDSFLAFALGMNSNGFISKDYYPLLPWLFIFIAGTYFGKFINTIQNNSKFHKKNSIVLSFIGRNTLIIYLIHQPIIYGIILIFTYK